jgi:hypothetical protein
MFAIEAMLARVPDSSAGRGRAIVAECKRCGWELVETIEDAGYSAKG